MSEERFEEEVYYQIATVSRLVRLSTQTIIRYESMGLIEGRSAGMSGRIPDRCYSVRMISKLHKIRSLTEDMGVNLAGVEVILQLLDRLDEAR